MNKKAKDSLRASSEHLSFWRRAWHVITDDVVLVVLVVITIFKELRDGRASLDEKKESGSR